jgi:hypothetical protein
MWLRERLAYKGENVPNRTGPSWKSLNWVASIAWIFFGSQVNMSQFLRMCVWNVNTVLPSCFDTISFRSVMWCGNLPTLLHFINRITLLIPNGSRLGRTGAGLQPSLFASPACLYLVIINVRSLYSTKTTTRLKINEVAERILSGRGTQLAIRKKVAFLKAGRCAV